MEALEDFLYHVPKEPKVRKEPMQVLALGISRSGTESLRTALLILGYNHTYHGYDVPATQDTEAWVRLSRRKYGIGARAKAALRANSGDAKITKADFDVIIGHCTAVTDLPCCAFVPEILAAYPGAKVILNRRKDVDAWHRSVLNTFGAYLLHLSPFEYFKSFFAAESYWIRLVFKEMWDPFFYGNVEANGKWVYREHCAKIRGMVPEDNLLEWSVEDGWEPLCQFLGKSTDGLPEFPSGNEPDSFAKQAVVFAVARETRAKRNMAIAGGAVGAIAAVLSWMVLDWTEW